MKKIIFIILSFLLTITLTACEKPPVLKNNVEATIEEYDKIGKYFKNYDLDFEYVTFKTKMENTTKSIEENQEFSNVWDKYYSVYLMAVQLRKNYNVASCLAYMDKNDEEAKNLENKIFDAYQDFVSWNSDVMVRVSKKDYAVDFYSRCGYAEDEIDKYAKMFEGQATEEYTALQKRQKELKNEYNLIETTDDIDKKAEINFEFINNNKIIAKILGYDNYLDYVDKELYSRQYTKEDINTYIESVKKYIAPYFISKTEAQKFTQTLTYDETQYFIELYRSSILDEDYNTLTLANEYARKMGMTYYSCYRNFMNNEYYCLGGKDAVQAGYATWISNQTIIFLGHNSQNVTSLIHEFGHYLSNVTNTTYNVRSLDLDEFYSQGNEKLFRAYLENTATPELKNVYEVYAKYEIWKSIYIIIDAAMMREFEEYVYTHEINSASELKTIWENIEKEFNVEYEDIWVTEIDYDAYDMSYGSSMAVTIDLYIEAKEDFNSAAKKYISAINNTTSLEINTMAKDVDLSDPFNEKTFIDISNWLEANYK